MRMLKLVMIRTATPPLPLWTILMASIPYGDFLPIYSVFLQRKANIMC